MQAKGCVKQCMADFIKPLFIFQFADKPGIFPNEQFRMTVDG
jgi:hypothetical protein